MGEMADMTLDQVAEDEGQLDRGDAFAILFDGADPMARALMPPLRCPHCGDPVDREGLFAGAYRCMYEVAGYVHVCGGTPAALSAALYRAKAIHNLKADIRRRRWEEAQGKGIGAVVPDTPDIAAMAEELSALEAEHKRLCDGHRRHREEREATAPRRAKHSVKRRYSAADPVPGEASMVLHGHPEQYEGEWAIRLPNGQVATDLDLVRVQTRSGKHWFSGVAKVLDPDPAGYLVMGCWVSESRWQPEGNDAERQILLAEGDDLDREVRRLEAAGMDGKKAPKALRSRMGTFAEMVRRWLAARDDLPLSERMTPSNLVKWRMAFAEREANLDRVDGGLSAMGDAGETLEAEEAEREYEDEMRGGGWR